MLHAHIVASPTALQSSGSGICFIQLKVQSVIKSSIKRNIVSQQRKRRRLWLSLFVNYTAVKYFMALRIKF